MISPATDKTNSILLFHWPLSLYSPLSRLELEPSGSLPSSGLPFITGPLFSAVMTHQQPAERETRKTAKTLEGGFFFSHLEFVTLMRHLKAEWEQCKTTPIGGKATYVDLQIKWKRLNEANYATEKATVQILNLKKWISKGVKMSRIKQMWLCLS